MSIWEDKYLRLCRDVIGLGYKEETRVGPARVLLGQHLSIDPGRNRFPILTTRKMYPKPVFGELAAFLKGATMNKQFEAEGCNYWKPNARAWNFNDGVLDEELVVGKVYGYQWRNFEGIDQYQEVLRLLKEEPSSRRIIMTCWNPRELIDMCLPPCHIMVQFHVRNGRLSLTIYMRSVDLALGLPSDVLLYYALLVHVAMQTNYEPEALHFFFGNAHVYEAHIEGLQEQVDREPYVPPLYFYCNWNWEFSPAHIQLKNYQYHEPIKFDLLV